ncbi:MAG: NAD-dependent DNA ligase LigA [Buchnera aphidicola (Floraphis choui)]
MTFIKNYILRLQEKIRYYGYLYYSLDSPEISDYRYDYLIKKLHYLENKYKEFLVTKNSPTLTVGSPGIVGFKKCKHITPMLSLNHVVNVNDYLEFDKKIKILLSEEKVSFCCELKIDGVAINLIYKKGILIKAITRGNGIEGEDVTNNVRMISSIPSKLRGFNIPKKLEVRGEIFMLKSDFVQLNNKAINNFTKIFSNTRNASSGLLRKKYSKTTAMKNLMFCCYGYGYYPRYIKIFNHYDRLEQLKIWGLPISGYNSVFFCSHDILNFYDKIKNIRQFLNFDIDGIVIKVNSIVLQNKLGYMRRAPKWAIAFKFCDQEQNSKVLNIAYQVGRTGVITPVAKIDPVRISGVIIKRVSLYNFNEIKRLDLYIGDIVRIKRSGDVIPKIVSVIKSNRSNDIKKIMLPNLCPSCKSKLKLDDQCIKVRCIEGIKCKEQLKKLLYYFCSRKGLNIYGLGLKIISKLVDKHYVKNFSDFFNLNFDVLVKLNDLGKKTARNIANSINQSKNITFSKFLCSLGINEIGMIKSEIIAKHFISLNSLMNSTFQELSSLKGIGPYSAHSVFSFINEQFNKEIILYLSNNLNIYSNDIQSHDVIKKLNPFFNKKCVISGSFHQFSRIKIVSIINELGGYVTSNVSRNTNYIIIGENPGSKLIKSKKFNIKVILKQDLLEIIKKFYNI